MRGVVRGFSQKQHDAQRPSTPQNGRTCRGGIEDTATVLDTRITEELLSKVRQTEAMASVVR